MELHITCDTPISGLNITFGDGGEVTCVTEPKTDKPVTTSVNSRDSQLVDTDVDFSSVSNEVVVKPDIDLGDREVSVTDEMQDLEL